MKLVIDENLPPRWKSFLGRHGFDAGHWTEIGACGDPDTVIFDHAFENRGIIVTQDLDFTRLVATRGSTLPSVILLRVACPIPESCGTILVNILRTYGEQLEQGCLISVEPDRHRVRLLPLR